MAWTNSFSGLTLTLTPATGTNSGLNLVGRGPGATLRIQGTTTLATVTGYNAGTANTGTTTTSVAKPAGGSNWTAAALVGKWLKITSGGGASTDGSLVLRPILSNTTTTLAVNVITGMDNTSVFEIVDLNSQIDYISSGDKTAIRIASCLGKVEVEGIDFSSAHALDGLLDILDCQDVTVRACKFAFNTVNAAVWFRRIIKLAFNDCRLTAASDIVVSQCQYVTSSGCVNSAGGVISITDAFAADVLKLTAASSPSTVLSMIRINSATAEVNASSGSATPIYLESCDSFTAVGTLLVGTGNTGYGMSINVAGQYNITGSTITGTTNDVLFWGSKALAYSNHLSGTYGAVSAPGMVLTAQVAVIKTIVYGNILWDGSGDHSSRELYYGIINPAQNVALTAAGTVVGNAYAMPAGQFYRFDTVAAGTGAKFHVASVLGGVTLMVHNNGANALTLYPGSGGTIDGAASYSLGVGVVKQFVIVNGGTDAWKSL